MDIGVAVEGPQAQEQEVMESANHGAEDHGAEAGNHAHRQGAEQHHHPPCGGPRLKGAPRFLRLPGFFCLHHRFPQGF
jgi:hypothetical protein